MQKAVYSRRCNESILKKVSYIIIHHEDYLMRDIQKSAKSQIQNKVALRQVVRKRVSFQDRERENTPKFPAAKYDIKQYSDTT